MTDLVRVTRGIWRPPAHVGDHDGLVAAVLAGCSGDTVVAGVNAARLHGLWLPPDRATHELPIDVIFNRDVPVLESRSRSVRPEVRGRRQQLRDDEVVFVDGIPVTSPARTWLDLAPVLSIQDLVAAGDCVLARRTDAAELLELVARAAHRRGVVRARQALPFLDPRSCSRPESHLRYAIVSAGLPKPEVNVSIYTDTHEWISTPDLSYDDVRLAMEYNGAVHADVDRMRRDITRENDVEMRGGWRQIVFGPAQVFARPDQIAARVRALRTERRRIAVFTVDPWGRTS